MACHPDAYAANIQGHSDDMLLQLTTMQARQLGTSFSKVANIKGYPGLTIDFKPHGAKGKQTGVLVGNLTQEYGTAIVQLSVVMWAAAGKQQKAKQ